MTIDQFTEKMIKRYSCKNEIYLEDLKNWLEKNQFGDLKLETLYEKIVENYEGFKMPSIAFMSKLTQKEISILPTQYKTIYKTMKDLSREVLRISNNMTIPEICNYVSTLRQMLCDDKDLTPVRHHFIAVWDELTHNYFLKTEENENESLIIAYCQPIRKQIESLAGY
jgi:hypothetical protein